MQKKVVLVVDDDDLLDFFADYIRQAGYTVFEAKSGHAAFQIFQQEKLDLIVSDVRMPNGDGKGLLASVKKEKPDIPVIMMTGYSAGAFKELKDLGADAILKKPFKLEELMEHVKNTLG